MIHKNELILVMQDTFKLFGTVTDLFAFSFFTSCFLFKRGRVKLTYFVLMSACFTLSVIGQKRTVLVCLVIVIYYLLYSRFPKNVIFVIVMGISLVVFSGLYANRDSLRQVLVEVGLGKLAVTDVGVDIGLQSFRFNEIVAVFDNLSDSGAHSFLIGKGSGATFEMGVAHPRTGETVFHSIHFSPGAVIYRSGIFGLFVYLYLFFYLFLNGALKEGDDFLDFNTCSAFAMKAYALGAFASSFVLFGFVDDLLLGVFCGVIGRWRVLRLSESIDAV
jgi:hypothetical protein